MAKQKLQTPQIRITQCSEYLTQTRGIKVGKIYNIILIGISENKQRKEPNFYFIEANNIPTVIYFDEAERVIKK